MSRLMLSGDENCGGSLMYFPPFNVHLFGREYCFDSPGDVQQVEQEGRVSAAVGLIPHSSLDFIFRCPVQVIKRYHDIFG